MLNDWEIRAYLRCAYEVARLSSDPSSQVGALIIDPDTKAIVSSGYNDIPRRVDKISNWRWQKPEKYKWVEHAERNAIFNACAAGPSCDGSIMVCPWACCVDCARAIIQSGIRALYVHQAAMEKTPKRWSESIQEAWDMLREAGVSIEQYGATIGSCPIRFNTEVCRF